LFKQVITPVNNLHRQPQQQPGKQPHNQAADGPGRGQRDDGNDKAGCETDQASAENYAVDAVLQGLGDGIDDPPEGRVHIAVAHIRNEAQDENDEAEA